MAGVKLGDPLAGGACRGARPQHGRREAQSWTVASLAIDDLGLAATTPAVGARPVQPRSARASLKAAVAGPLRSRRAATLTDPGQRRQGAIDSLAMTVRQGQGRHFRLTQPRRQRQGGERAVIHMADVKAIELDLGGPYARCPHRPGGRACRSAGSISSPRSLSASAASCLSATASRSAASPIRPTHESERRQAARRMRIEGFVMAPPAATSKALQMRIVLQAMGLKELQARPRLLRAPRTAPRARWRSTAAPSTVPISASSTFAQAGERRCDLLAGDRRRQHRALLGSKAGLGRPGSCWPIAGLLERTLKALGDDHRPVAGRGPRRPSPGDPALSAARRADHRGPDQAARYRRALRREAAAPSPSTPSPTRRSASTSSTISAGPAPTWSTCSACRRRCRSR